MGLASRIEEVGDALAGRRGCSTCAWYAELPQADKDAFDLWVAEGKSHRGLWRLCVDEGLQITSTPFRDHVANHHQRGQK